MMTNLFSSFDPSTQMGSMNWTSIFIFILLMPQVFWLIPSRYNMAWILITETLYKELKIIINNKKMTIMFISLFSLIMINNFMGLMPYIFTSTSHLSFSLTLALPLWLSFMMFGWTKNTTSMLAHLVPEGTPGLLMPFMVCIETISNIIRPLTLAIRLTANMIAGHLLMTLLGNTGSSMPMPLISILIIVQTALLTLESAVSIIQSYVFTILSTLYSSDVH